jgi:toxin-antitoxin system PIN domain toxin
VILVDANLLLYAYRPRAEQHAESRAWLETVLSGPDLVRFAWLTLWAFLRIATNSPRVRTSTVHDRSRRGDILLACQPAAGILDPGERHWDIVRGLLHDGEASGPLVMDAILAAIALEHGATVCTTDRDFSRFSGLKWINPLGESLTERSGHEGQLSLDPAPF